ncbi:MAG: EAL domain-containing protein [Pseudanabaena sp. SU_2_4]|nr:EAL domain-containing protein [Pseudanabaena sp. SU_2_4]
MSGSFHSIRLKSTNLCQRFAREPKDAEIVTAIVALGQGLNLKVVAEGVETESLKDRLISIGCELMQGYFFSRPLPPEDATRLLMHRS